MLDRVDGLDDMAHRLLLDLSEVWVPAIHQQDQARLVRAVPGLVFIGVVEEDRFALAPAVLDPAHVERAVGRNDEWQVEHEPVTAEWSKFAGVHATVLWQVSHCALVMMCVGGLPVAVVPLWQLAQVPETAL